MNPYCTGCGRVAGDATGECDGSCRRTLDPPRFCPTCGRRLAVQVAPTEVSARCRDCGPIGS